MGRSIGNLIYLWTLKISTSEILLGLEDDLGVYGIAGVSRMSKDKAEYFNYEGSARGSYSRQGHIGILARIHSHFDILESSTFYRIVADRESAAARRPQYIHELCSRPKTQFQMYNLASLPIIFNAGVLQMQMKQLSIFIEQVYLVYFGNYSGTPHS